MTLDNIYQRKAPFLHRNWLQGLKNWPNPAGTMGNIVSGQLGSDSHAAAPPRKRRRISTPESLDVDHLIASPKTSDTRSALRIEVLKVCHKDSKKVRTNLGATAPRDVVTTKANCRITITDLSEGGKVLHCQNQVCDLTTFKNPVGPHRIARVHLARPFFVPLESMLVNREDDGTFDLSDTYELLVEFEAASGGHWPPLDASDFGHSAAFQDAAPSAARRLVLLSRFRDMFGKHKEPLVLSAQHRPDKPYSLTEYVMDVDLRWSSGFKAWKRLDKDSMPCITAIDPDTDMGDENFPPMGDEDSVAVNGITGINNMNAFVRSDDEQTEGERTPSRSLRTRERNKVYNLKVLSDQARGKERKRQPGAGSLPAEGRVMYLLPSDQPVSLDCHRCVTCGSCHESLIQLQMHLQTYHPGYDFICEKTSQGPQFRVRHRRSDSFLSPSKTFQVKPTAEPFNLETYIGGNPSWVTSRVIAGPNDDLLRTPSARATADRMASNSPIPKQPSFVGTKATLARRPNRAKKEPAVVPKTSRPLFHPISKAELKPGEPVPSAEPDSTWLIQKHRESIADFSDVTAAEKEFIWQWDGYILKQGITSSVYLPRAWLGFVQENADWLTAKNERMFEFGKHLSVLMAREVLTDDAINQAQVHIGQARSLRTMDLANAILPLETDAAAATPKATDIKKGSNGCTICRLPVRGPRLLVCANKVRPTRIQTLNIGNTDLVGNRLAPRGYTTRTASNPQQWLT